MSHLTRREFGALASSVAVGPFAFAQTPPRPAAAFSAQELFDRIKAQIGVAWKPDSADGVKAGDPSTVATGVVTTALATLAVLQQAVTAGANVVVSSQPTFYSRTDSRTPSSPADPVFAAKNAFIDKHKLVVFRLHEHWRLREPDPLALGLARALGWTRHQVAGNPRRYDVAALTADALVRSLAKSLGSRGGIRVVGEPNTSVRRIGLLPGSSPIQASLTLLPEVDAIVAGEVREWESVEYARDVVASGGRKALILIGRVVSEEPGMGVCAEWLQTLVPGGAVRHIAAGDPYWRPA